MEGGKWIKLNDTDDISGAVTLALDMNDRLRKYEVNQLFPDARFLKYKDENASSTTRLCIRSDDNPLTIRFNNETVVIHTSAPDASSTLKQKRLRVVPFLVLSALQGQCHQHVWQRKSILITMIMATLLATMLQSLAADLTKHVFPDNSCHSWFARCVLLVLVGLTLDFFVNHIYSK